MRRSILLTTVVLALLASGCGGGAADRDAPPADDGAFDGTVDGTDVDEPTGDGTPPVDDLASATDAAVATLAADAGVSPEDVEVVTAERVTWNDGSLGCPEPGQVYTQALVPGYRIVLAVAGEEVAFHGADDAPPTRCDDPQPPAEGAS